MPDNAGEAERLFSSWAAEEGCTYFPAACEEVLRPSVQREQKELDTNGASSPAEYGE